MIARFAPVVFAVVATVAASNLVRAQANADLRCIANPDAKCVIELAERSFPHVREDRWHLVVPNLSEAMLYSGRTRRGLELAEKIQSPAMRTRVYMTHAYVLFHAGKLDQARAVLNDHARTKQRAREVVLWALNAYEQGDTTRGDEAVELAREILKDHEAATGDTISEVNLPSAIAASGKIDAAIEMVREMPELADRTIAAFLLVDILAREPDAGPARVLMRDASAWRKSLDPMMASVALYEEAWAWLMLGDAGQAIRIAEESPHGKRRDGLLAFLISNAGPKGRTEDALIMAERIESTSVKAWALAQCAEAAFYSRHLGTAAACLEAARGPVAEVMDMAERGGFDDDQTQNINFALGAAANAESLAGNDAAVAKVMKAAGIHAVDMDDKIIGAHISAGDYSLAILLAFNYSDALKQTRALSSMARALSKKELAGE